MDNRRVIGKILLNGNWAVQSKHFKTHLPLGRPEIIAEFLDHWQVDEILLIDRLASREGRTIDPDIVSRVVEVCRTPLTVGGGIKTVRHAKTLVKNGADRVCINSSAYQDPQVIQSLSDVLGSQAVVAHGDFIYQGSQPVLFDHINARATDVNIDDFAVNMVANGAGEIILHSVERDGTKTGYDESLYRNIGEIVGVPLIASGGYGVPSHASDVLATGVSGIAIGNQLHFNEHSVSVIKTAINDASIRATSLGYSADQVDASGRLIKSNEEYLDQLRFKKREGRWL